MEKIAVTLIVLLVVIALAVAMALGHVSVKFDSSCVTSISDGCVPGKPYRYESE